MNMPSPESKFKGVTFFLYFSPLFEVFSLPRCTYIMNLPCPDTKIKGVPFFIYFFYFKIHFPSSGIPILWTALSGYENKRRSLFLFIFHTKRCIFPLPVYISYEPALSGYENKRRSHFLFIFSTLRYIFPLPVYLYYEPALYGYENISPLLSPPPISNPHSLTGQGDGYELSMCESFEADSGRRRWRRHSWRSLGIPGGVSVRIHVPFPVSVSVRVPVRVPVPFPVPAPAPSLSISLSMSLSLFVSLSVSQSVFLSLSPSVSNF
jgi:hypothetical protein